MRNKIFGCVCLTLAIVIIVTTGTTFAYYSAGATSNAIEGDVINFDVDLQITTVYKATQLIPIMDTDITKAISKATNKCRDNNGYDVCSMYTLNLTNSGDAVIMNGYVKTITTTYTTNNLKYQIFDSSLNPVTDAASLSKTVNESVYFKKNSNLVATTMTSQNLSYYLVIWLTETGSLQNSDYSKTFTGAVAFETINGGKIEADFAT